MDARDLVAYCGLYCGLCDQRTRIPERAAALRDSLRKADFEAWGPGFEGFAPFWKLLGELIEVPDVKRCRDGECGAPFCAIRKCARERQVEACPYCGEYPCERIDTLGRSEPTLLHDAQRLREIGLEAWMAEQEQRRADGFCYADVRCGACHVPDK